jgi:hypothetical protein
MTYSKAGDLTRNEKVSVWPHQYQQYELVLSTERGNRPTTIAPLARNVTGKVLAVIAKINPTIRNT